MFNKNETLLLLYGVARLRDLYRMNVALRGYSHAVRFLEEFSIFLSALYGRWS